MWYKLNMEIKNNPTPDPLKPDSNQQLSNIGSVLLNLNKNQLNLINLKLKACLKGLTEIAMSFGMTNDEEAFEEQMAEDIIESLKIAENNRAKRKKRNNYFFSCFFNRINNIQNC